MEKNTAALSMQQVANGLVENDPLTNASKIRLLNGDLVTINLTELTRIVNHFFPAPQAVAEGVPVHEQNARWAIDGAISYGVHGINKPPSDDHWLMQYWQIGQQIEKARAILANNAAPERAAIQPAGAPPVDSSIEAIQFALVADEGMQFLHHWNIGNFDVCRFEWPEAPDDVYIGADSLHPQSESAALHERSGKAEDEKPFAWRVGFDLFLSHETALHNVRNPDLKPEPLYTHPAAHSSNAAPAPTGESVSVPNWAACMAITDVRSVHEALEAFGHDMTGDNATCIVKAVFEAAAGGPRHD